MFNHSFSQSSSQFGGNISQGQPDQLPPESALWQLYPSEQSQQQLINNLPKQMTECMSCDRLNGFQRGNGQFSSDQCLSLLTSPKFPDRNSSLLTVTNTVIEENGSDPSGTTTEAYLSYLTQAVLPKGKTTMEIHTQLNTIGYLVTCALSTASGGGDGQQVRKQDPFQDLYQLSPGPPRSFQNQPKIRLSVEAVSSILGFLVSNCAEPKAAGISLPIIADLCKLLNPALICARIFDLLNQEDPDLSVSQYKRGIIGKSSIAVNLLDWIHKEVLKQFGFSSIPFDVLVSGVKPFFTHKEQRVRQAIANIVGYIMYIEQNASQAILSSSWAHVYQKQITIESACNMEEVNVNFKKVIETAAKSCGQNDLQPPTVFPLNVVFSSQNGSSGSFGGTHGHNSQSGFGNQGSGNQNSFNSSNVLNTPMPNKSFGGGSSFRNQNQSSFGSSNGFGNSSGFGATASSSFIPQQSGGLMAFSPVRPLSNPMQSNPKMTGASNKFGFGQGRTKPTSSLPPRSGTTTSTRTSFGATPKASSMRSSTAKPKARVTFADQNHSKFGESQPIGGFGNSGGSSGFGQSGSSSGFGRQTTSGFGQQSGFGQNSGMIGNGMNAPGNTRSIGQEVNQTLHSLNTDQAAQTMAQLDQLLTNPDLSAPAADLIRLMSYIGFFISGNISDSSLVSGCLRVLGNIPAVYPTDCSNSQAVYPYFAPSVASTILSILAMGDNQTMQAASDALSAWVGRIGISCVIPTIKAVLGDSKPQFVYLVLSWFHFQLDGMIQLAQSNQIQSLPEPIADIQHSLLAIIIPLVYLMDHPNPDLALATQIVLAQIGFICGQESFEQELYTNPVNLSESDSNRISAIFSTNITNLPPFPSTPISQSAGFSNPQQSFQDGTGTRFTSPMREPLQSTAFEPNWSEQEWVNNAQAILTPNLSLQDALNFHKKMVVTNSDGGGNVLANCFSALCDVLIPHLQHSFTLLLSNIQSPVLPDAIRLVRYAINSIVIGFNTQQSGNTVGLQHVYQILSTLLFIANHPLFKSTHTPDPSLVNVFNLTNTVLLRVLENGNRVLVLQSLIQLMGETMDKLRTMCKDTAALTQQDFFHHIQICHTVNKSISKLMPHLQNVVGMNGLQDVNQLISTLPAFFEEFLNDASQFSMDIQQHLRTVKDESMSTTEQLLGTLTQLCAGPNRNTSSFGPNQQSGFSNSSFNQPNQSTGFGQQNGVQNQRKGGVLIHV